MKKALHVIALRVQRTWHVMLLISTVATALGALWWHFDLVSISDAERGAYDDGLKKFTGKSWFPWGQPGRSEHTVIIAIDDKTFAALAADEGAKQRYGSWPYDRVIYADVLEYLQQVGARQVVFDATMDEPRQDQTGDIAFGEAIAETGVPFGLGFNVTPVAPPTVKVASPVNRRPAPPKLKAVPVAAPADAGDGADEQFPSEEFPAEDAVDAGAVLAARVAKAAQEYAFPVQTAGGLELTPIASDVILDETGKPTGREAKRWPVPSIEPLLGPVSAWGIVSMEEDEDGKLRRTRFAYTDGLNSYVTLPVAVAADLLGADSVTMEPGWLTIGPRRVKVDQDGSASIRYGGTLNDRFRTISLVDVLRLKKSGKGGELFRDKVVFIGGFALGTADVKPTPLEQQVPAVVKQAETLECLMWGEFITDAPFWVSLLLTFFVCLCSTALVLVVRNSFVDIGWPVLLYIGFFVVTGSAMVLTGTHILSALPSLAGTLASVVATTWERIFASKEREEMKEMFKAYMESDLVDMMIEQHELPKLDGQVMRITAYFSDIKGFSTFSERFHENPKDLMRLLNRYLSAVTPVLTKEGACIDKYIGDAVVALFGAPVPHDDHALRACRGALKVQEMLAELCRTFAAEGLPDVTTRIGLNTDTLLVGNIGSAQLLDYTAIGDGMNLASRLEGANKAYGTHIMMGENTWGDVKDHVVARELDLVRVAGKHVATRIYELVGMKGQVPAEVLARLDRFHRGLTLFRARQFHEALAVFRGVLEEDPKDGPSLTFVARCEQFLAEPPPPEWDGVADLGK